MVIITSCLGMSLLTAGVVIGWVDIFICVVECVAFVLLLLDVPYIAERLVRSSKQHREVAVRNMKLCVYITFVLIDLMACILLVIGTEKMNRYMLIPWLFSNSLSIIFQIASSLFLATGSFLSTRHRLLKLCTIVINLFLTGIHTWMWLVIFSLHVHIRHILKHN